MSIALLAVTLLLSAPAQAQSVPARGDFAGLVEVGGRRLFLECHGAGSPLAILISGYRNTGEI